MDNYLKMHESFFENDAIKKMKSNICGDTYVLIYMKIILLVNKTNGIYEIEDYEELLDSIALDIEEDESKVKNTIEYLVKNNLAKIISKTSIYFKNVFNE